MLACSYCVSYCQNYSCFNFLFMCYLQFQGILFKICINDSVFVDSPANFILLLLDLPKLSFLALSVTLEYIKYYLVSRGGRGHLLLITLVPKVLYQLFLIRSSVTQLCGLLLDFD